MKTRIRRAQESLAADALLVDAPTDLLYLTGLDLSLGRLAIFPDRACLFVDGRYIERAKKDAPCEAQLKEGLKEYLRDARTVGFDSAFVTYDGFRVLEERLPGKEWVPIEKPLKRLRAVKERQEIEALRRAARLTWEGYRHIEGLLKEDVTEEELALEFEFFCRKRGASRLSFSPNIAFGANSAYPHYRAGKAKLRRNQIVLFDLGAVVDGYCGDMTRVAFFGHPDPRLEKDYQLARSAQQRAIEAVRPGVRFGDLDQIVREEFRKEKVETLFTHGLSHGIGLDLHEFPHLRIDGGDADLILEPGMVFTVEPGIYRPGLGGVRYEDTILVTDTGVENFYPS